MLRRLAGAFDKVAAFIACALVAALLGCVSLGVVTRSLGEPLIWISINTPLLLRKT